MPPPPGLYQHTTLGAAKALLASALGDPGMVFWTSPELTLYIADTLRMLGLMTGFWRQRITISTKPGVAFYDLASAGAPLGVVDYTVSILSIIQQMQYMLMEPPSASAPLPPVWTGSDQFTLSDLSSALQRARNQLLDDTMISLVSRAYPVAPGDGRLNLDDDVSSIRRAVWRSPSNIYSNIHWSDESEAAYYNSSYPLAPGTPDTYSVLSAPPLQMQLVPTNLDLGTVEMIVSATGANIDLATAGQTLGIPDDVTWVVREMAMADLLDRDGPARDPMRASFSNSRYQLGVSLANSMAQILYVELNGQSIIPSGLAEIDYAYASPHWQSRRPGPPTDVGIIGGNLVAVRPVPDGVYTIGLDVVRKATQPVGDGDYLQLGREMIDTLLDGSQALALFKVGGGELRSAASLTDSLISGAARYNSKLSVFGKGLVAQLISRLDEGSRPERAGGRGVGTVSASQVANAQAAQAQQGSGASAGGGAPPPSGSAGGR